MQKKLQPSHEFCWHYFVDKVLLFYDIRYYMQHEIKKKCSFSYWIQK